MVQRLELPPSKLTLSMYVQQSAQIAIELNLVRAKPASAAEEVSGFLKIVHDHYASHWVQGRHQAAVATTKKRAQDTVLVLVDLLTDSITGAVALTAAPGPTDVPTQTAAAKVTFLSSFQEQLLPEAFAILASLHLVKEMGLTERIAQLQSFCRCAMELRMSHLKHFEDQVVEPVEEEQSATEEVASPDKDEAAAQLTTDKDEAPDKDSVNARQLQLQEAYGIVARLYADFLKHVQLLQWAVPATAAAPPPKGVGVWADHASKNVQDCIELCKADSQAREKLLLPHMIEAYKDFKKAHGPAEAPTDSEGECGGRICLWPGIVAGDTGGTVTGPPEMTFEGIEEALASQARADAHEKLKSELLKAVVPVLTSLVEALSGPSTAMVHLLNQDRFQTAMTLNKHLRALHRGSPALGPQRQ